MPSHWAHFAAFFARVLLYRFIIKELTRILRRKKWQTSDEKEIIRIQKQRILQTKNTRNSQGKVRTCRMNLKIPRRSACSALKTLIPNFGIYKAVEPTKLANNSQSAKFIVALIPLTIIGKLLHRHKLFTRCRNRSTLRKTLNHVLFEPTQPH